MSEQQLETQPNKTAPSVKDVIAFLCERFPACFSQDAEQIKPLKKGIFQDLSAELEGNESISKTSLRQALRVYTRSWRYLAVCTAEAARVGLNGEADGVVDAQEAEHAVAALKESREAYQTKRKEEQAQKRKEQRKAFFKQKARDENAKKRAAQKNEMPKASVESLAALADKFAKK